ncbi:MAG: glycosyltransferase [Stomatobaculum sp.]
MKKISVVIPCYNEEENVGPITAAVAQVFREQLPAYDYEILLIDNDSQDRTRDRIRLLCAENPRIKAIFNAKNFGQFNSPYYAMLQSEGDATVLMAADFQDPPAMIAKYAAAWEEGYKIAIGIKTHSEENSLMYWLRSEYYKWIRRLSEVDQIEHFTGFGLYDRAFIQVLRGLNDPTPFLRGIVAELGYRRKEIPYDQPRRRAGKTSNNFYKLYDAAMLSVTSYTKFGLRLATLVGGLTMTLSVVIAMVYLVMKLLYWDRFQAGLAPLLIGMLFLGAVIIFFIGMMGEYILTINQRVMRRPLVVEEERLNFGSGCGAAEDTDSVRLRTAEASAEQGGGRDGGATESTAFAAPRAEGAAAERCECEDSGARERLL